MLRNFSILLFRYNFLFFYLFFSKCFFFHLQTKTTKVFIWNFLNTLILTSWMSGTENWMRKNTLMLENWIFFFRMLYAGWMWRIFISISIIGNLLELFQWNFQCFYVFHSIFLHTLFFFLSIKTQQTLKFNSLTYTV